MRQAYQKQQRSCLDCGSEIQPGTDVCDACRPAWEREEQRKLRHKRIDAAIEVMVPIRSLEQRKLVKPLARLHSPDLPVDRWCREAVEWLRAWRPGSPGGWFVGGCGSGKTTLVWELYRWAINQGHSCLGCDLQTLVRKLVAISFDRHQRKEYDRMMSRLAAIDLLIIDDVLASSLNTVELDAFLSVLNARWGTGKPLIVTANVERGPGLDEALRWWGKEDQSRAARIVSRVRALTGRNMPCMYPGDRRIPDSLDPIAAEALDAALKTWDYS